MTERNPSSSESRWARPSLGSLTSLFTRHGPTTALGFGTLRNVSGSAQTPTRTKMAKQPNRDWDDAIRKVREEAECRVCGVQRNLQAAHLAPRTHDKPKRFGSKTLYVEPNNCVSLCASCHFAFDSHRFDLLEYLTIEEQAHVVAVLGGIENARMRLAPLDYRPEIEGARIKQRMAA